MAYEMWMMEQVRVTARRLGSSVTLLGGAPDPYEQRMIKSATPTLRPTFDLFQRLLQIYKLLVLPEERFIL